MRHYTVITLLFALALTVTGRAVASGDPADAAALSIDRVDPPHWWVGWKESQAAMREVELLIEGRGLTDAQISVEGNGVRIIRDKAASNTRYRYLRLALDDTAGAQSVVIKAQSKGLSATYGFELRERHLERQHNMGLSPSDLIYLVTPDRFANGDLSNDVVSSMRENTVDRSDPYGRHGGDLAGIRQSIDHLDSVGATALWLSPVLENDMPTSSYHGYAITDHYRIDPRLGSLKDYRSLASDLHDRGKRLIMDVVFNHIGSEHRLFRQPPDSAWFNWWPTYTQTNGRASTIHDPNAVWADRERMLRGWFDRTMPDVNQEHGHAALYLMQHVVWWIEEVGIDALRIDTYPYSDVFFMRDIVRLLRTIYPNLGIVGEVWADNVVTQGTFGDRRGDGDERTWLPSLTDFQLYESWIEALTKPSTGNAGVARLYRTLSADNMYDRPQDLMIFLDNHDLGRFYGVIGRDYKKFVQGLSMLMTMRGTPCLYYGTEFLFDQTDGHGKIRQDVPGGWPGDKRSVFTAKGRTPEQNNAMRLVQQLSRFRASCSAITSGTFRQLTPENGVYAYARFDTASTVVVAVNTDKTARTIDLGRFGDIVPNDGTARDVLSSEAVNISAPLTIQPSGTVVLEIK